MVLVLRLLASECLFRDKKTPETFLVSGDALIDICA